MSAVGVEDGSRATRPAGTGHLGPQVPTGIARVDVTNYPSPSTTRLMVLLLAMLASALFAGTWLHNQVRGDAWMASVTGCLAGGRPTGDLVSAVRQQEAFQACTADAERLRAWFVIGVTLAVALAGLVIVAAAPRVIERRRALRPADERFAGARDRLAALAREAGLTRPSLAMVGTARQRDAFSYGVPGRYRVVLPKALAIRAGSGPFDAVIRHELQHIAHRDVALAWLARASGYALAAIFGVPVLLDVTKGDLSVLPSFAWRAAVLAAAILLARAAWLRSREHDADLRAAYTAREHHSIVTALDPVAQAEAGARHSEMRERLRGMLANHPDAARRIAVLRAPQTARSVTALDALTVAFFAAVALPLLGQVLSPLLSAAGHVGWLDPISAGLLGPLVGATLGLGLWRDALLSRVSGVPPQVARIAGGVFVGTAAGQATTLAAAGSGSLTTQDHPWAALVIAVAAAGATVLAAGLGELWADAAPGLPRAAASWIPAILLSGTLFTVTVWFAAVFQRALDQSGWTWASAALVTVLASAPMAWAALLLATAAAWALHNSRRPAPPPVWMAESHRAEAPTSALTLTNAATAGEGTSAEPVPRGSLPWHTTGSGGAARVLLIGAGAGLTGGAAITVYRVVMGPAADFATQEQRYYTYLALAALTAAAAGAALAVLVPRRGPGAALLAVATAVLATQACFLGLNTAFGGALNPQFAWAVTQPALALGLLTLVIAAAATPAVHAIASTVVRPGRRHPEPGLRAVTPALTAVTLAGLVAGSTLVGRGALLPLFDSSGAVSQFASPPPATSSTPTPSPAAPTATQSYLQQVVPVVEATYQQIGAAAEQIRLDTTISEPQRGTRLRGIVLPALEEFVSIAEQVHTGVPDVDDAHAHAVAALRAMHSGYTAEASYDETGDPDALLQAITHQQTAVAQWRQWRALVVILGLS